MTTRKRNSIKETLNSCFPRKWIMETARETGWMKRQRKIDPVSFFWTLILGFGTGVDRMIADLRRAYELATNTTLVPSGFYNRFNPSLVAFLKEAIRHACETLAEPVGRMKGTLKHFIDLVVIDSTVIRLHGLLEKFYKACRTNHSKSALKLNIVMSVFGISPRTIMIATERKSEGKLLRIGPWVKGRLLLFDLGYFVYSLFERIARNGGYFISRLKDNANPKILFSHRAHRGRKQPIEAMKLKKVLARMKRKVIDVQIQITVNRREYKGRKNKVTKDFRLIGIRNDETGEYHLYITNIPVDYMSPEDIAKTYAARWEVELIFKELKSYYRIDQLPSASQPIVESLIYTAILTLVISRALIHELRQLKNLSTKETPNRRWAVVFHSVVQRILMLLNHKGRCEKMWLMLQNFIDHECKDPNISRALKLNFECLK